MAYDPQADRRRPRPSDEDPAPVDAMLDQDAVSAGASRRPVPEDPPPSPKVTPAPADPPPDTLLFNTGIAGVVALIMGLLLARHLWRRRRLRRAAPFSADSL